MSGKYGTSNAGAESVGVSDCNKVYKEAGNEAVMSISVDDCIDLDGKELSILAKVKKIKCQFQRLLKHRIKEKSQDFKGVKKELFLGVQRSFPIYSDERCVWIDLVGLPLASWAPKVYKKVGAGRMGEAACLRIVLIYRNRTYRIIATEFAYWAPNIESMEVNSESNPLERKDAEGPSLDESLENEEHLDVDSCDSDSPKNVNNDSVSPSSRVLREEDVRRCGDVNHLMIMRMLTPVIAPEKDSIIAPPSTPPGNDLNIAAESGSSWTDYIGPLTSDEIDSDKRWSYRDPNGNIHGLFSLTQLRSWKDYFPRRSL
ncbi:RNA-directed DNA polymerase, eukaryota [Tanacetum coccineum]